MPSGAAVADPVAPDGAKKSVFRPDIQGLRMIAVLAVIADHLLHWPSGGFVGVDVFFVISGFLITSLLIREHEKTGSISFVGFYRRRIKRITPAATLVIAVTIAAAFVIYTTGRAVSVAWDGFWAFFFAANWNFAAAGTDYFQASGPVSPLQHYWSLSVEEQFYLVWPWMMLAIFVIVGARRKLLARRLVGIAILIITAASFAWAMYETATNPTMAYFSTFSRAWELGLGAIVAVYAASFSKQPLWLRTILGWVGLIGILASLFIVPAGNGFPAPWAALPVFFTALTIVAGTGGEQRFLWPITNPVSSYLGDISYSLYLWHWPIIVLAAAFFPASSPLYYAVCLGLIAFTSVLSYHLIEDPIRRSSWLEPRVAVRRRRHRHGSVPPIGYAAVAVLAVGVITLSVVALMPRHQTASAQPIPTRTPTATATAAASAILDPATEDARVTADLQAGLAASKWPNMEMTADALKALQAPDLRSEKCYNDFTTANKWCDYGTGRSGHSAALVGDSIALSWAPALRDALPDWKLTTYGKYGCPYVSATVSYPEGPRYDNCREFQTAAFDRINQQKPQVVFLATAHYTIGDLSSGAKGDAAIAEWAQGIDATVAALRPSGARIVIIGAPPAIRSLSDCATNFNAPTDCEGAINDDARASDQAIAAAIAADPSITFIDTQQWFCVDGRCPQVVADQPIRSDPVHVTEAYSKKLAPNLLARIQQITPDLFTPASS